MANVAMNEQPQKQYIAVAPFNTAFYNYYTVKTSPWATVGKFEPVGLANAENCPKGRILRENGKKLYPKANPDVTKYMVGVYDSVSQLQGYIDPNSYPFAPFSNDKPYFLEDTPGDIGPSVYCNTVESVSTITAGSSLRVGSSIWAGSWISSIGSITSIDFIQSGTSITAAKQIRSSATTVVPVMNLAANINVSAGQIFVLNIDASSYGTTVGATNLGALTGAIVYLIINNLYNGGGDFANNSILIQFNPSILTSLNPKRLTMNNASKYIMTFVCDGSNLVEVSRNGPLI